MFKVRKYHEKKVMSLTYESRATSFSVGIVAVGEFAFGALIDEYYRVTSGNIYFWNDEVKEGKFYSEGEEFIVKQGHNFKMKAEEVSTYICFYK